MALARILRHLSLPDWWARRAIPESTLRAIENAVAASEQKHCAELRFVVEASLPLHDLWRDRPTRARALEAFSQLRVWDTEHNSGVLIYVQLLDHRVEIVTDRGIHARVGSDFWDGVCRRMEAAFSRGEFEPGCLAALDEITALLAAHYPAGADNPNELPNRPALR